nr:hypothetical protein CFP56_39372 [Quercus suber]
MPFFKLLIDASLVVQQTYKARILTKPWVRRDDQVSERDDQSKETIKAEGRLNSKGTNEIDLPLLCHGDGSHLKDRSYALSTRPNQHPERLSGQCPWHTPCPSLVRENEEERRGLRSSPKASSLMFMGKSWMDQLSGRMTSYGHCLDGLASPDEDSEDELLSDTDQ